MARVQQAGAIAVNIDGPRPKFLVVTAKRDPDHWIFPKGHIEAGETPEAAAVRELAEETGVRGESIRAVGTASFRSGDEDVEVTYFLVRATGQEPATERRQVRWLDHAEARERLTFENSRVLLDRAASTVNR